MLAVGLLCRLYAVNGEQETRAEFDEFAKQYENSVDQSVSFTGRDSAFFARRKVEILEDIVRPGLGSLQGLNLLDVGCGTGTTDRYLAPRVRNLHGVDISEEMLVKAERNVPKGTYSHYDGKNLPFDGGTFDVVVAICVLHHVPVSMRPELVRDMVRVARPGGIVAIFEHNPLNPLTRHAVNTCELDEDAVLLPSREAADLLKTAAEIEPCVPLLPLLPIGGRSGVFGRPPFPERSSGRPVRGLGAPLRLRSHVGPSRSKNPLGIKATSSL